MNNEHVEVKKAKETGIFTNYIFKAIPLAFDESMSYYETLCALLDYLKNTIIPTVNNNADAVIELQNNVDEFETNITEQQNNYEEHITELFNQLQTFVNDYFDNLDVQTEINNKLDEMTENGTLTNLIANYVDPIYQTYETNINGMINEINTKVNNLASGSPLVASSTSEMTDTTRVYVNTTDGKWYYYDGTSWVIGGTYQATEDSTTVNDNANKISYILERGNIKIYGAEYGGLTSNNTEVTNTIRARTKIINTLHCKKIYYKIPSTLKRQNIICCINNTWDDITSNQIKYTTYNDGMIAEILDNTITAIRLIFVNSTNSSQDITQSELNSISIIPFNNIDDNIINTLENNTLKNDTNTALTYGVELGGFDSNNVELETNTRCRTKIIKSLNIKKIIIETSLDLNFAIGYINGNWQQLDSSIYYSDKIYTIPQDCEYIRFSFKHTDGSTIISNNELQNTCIKIYDQLTEYYNKKYVALGDSITYGFIPRNYTGYPGQLDSFCKLTADNLNMTFVNAGISGNTVATVDNITNAMCRRYVDLPNDADLITFMGGINDFRNGVPLGTFNDRIETTFYGALHILFAGLYKKYYIDQGTTTGKKKKIVVMTPIKNLLTSSDTQGGTGTLRNISSFVNAIKEVAEYYSFPVLDMYNLSGINPHLNETIQGTETGYTGFYNPYITDGTHPTQEGHYIMSKVLEGFLKSII